MIISGPHTHTHKENLTHEPEPIYRLLTLRSTSTHHHGSLWLYSTHTRAEEESDVRDEEFLDRESSVCEVKWRWKEEEEFSTIFFRLLLFRLSSGFVCFFLPSSSHLVVTISLSFVKTHHHRLDFEYRLHKWWFRIFKRPQSDWLWGWLPRRHSGLCTRLASRRRCVKKVTRQTTVAVGGKR